MLGFWFFFSTNDDLKRQLRAYVAEMRNEVRRLTGFNQKQTRSKGATKGIFTFSDIFARRRPQYRPQPDISKFANFISAACGDIP